MPVWECKTAVHPSGQCRILPLMVLMPTLQVQYSADGTAVSTRYDPGGDMVRELQANSTGMDERLQQSQIRLIQNGMPLQAGEGTSLPSGASE